MSLYFLCTGGFCSLSERIFQLEWNKLLCNIYVFLNWSTVVGNFTVFLVHRWVLFTFGASFGISIVLFIIFLLVVTIRNIDVCALS